MDAYEAYMFQLEAIFDNWLEELELSRHTMTDDEIRAAKEVFSEELRVDDK